MMMFMELHFIIINYVAQALFLYCALEAGVGHHVLKTGVIMAVVRHSVQLMVAAKRRTIW